MWVERWRLTLEELPGVGQEENPFGCEVHTLLTVKAFSESPEDTFRPTQVGRQASFLQAELVRRAVGNVVQDMIDGVPIPGEPQPLTADDPVRERFNKANFRGFEGRARYFYSHAPFFLLRRLAEELLGLLGAAEGFTPVSPVAAALQGVDEWDWSVLQLDNVVTALSDPANGPTEGWPQEHVVEVQRLSAKLEALKAQMSDPVEEGEDVHAKLLEGILHALGDVEVNMAVRRAAHDAEQEAAVADGTVAKKKKFNERQHGTKEVTALFGKGLHLFEFPIPAPEPTPPPEPKKSGKGK